MLKDQLDEHNKGRVAIHRRLAEFGTEQAGIFWIYGSVDDDEREYRDKVAEAEAAESRAVHDEIMSQLHRKSKPDDTAEQGSGENISNYD